ncbi:MAG: hypothetical protein M3Q63_00875 [bacterium]|nr:hypothetical protein [bacterium]
MLHDLIVSLWGESTYRVLAILFRLYPLWLPLTLGIAFWQTWVRYVRWNFFVNTPTTLLEVRLPKEITKSPAAMELALHALYQTGGESTVIAKYWEGKTRDWFSLEIASIGGEVRFYIWTRNRTRNIIEAYIYSHFGDVEIREVADYTKSVRFDPNVNNIWGTTYKKKLGDSYPIKTYVDYGLDKDPKEELEHNPLFTLLEQFGSLKPQENIWLQLVVRAHKKEKRRGFFSKAHDFSKDLEERRKEFREGLEGRAVPTELEGKLINALERSVYKHAFDVGIRVLYVADKSAYSNTTITMLRNLFRPFGAEFSSDKNFPSFGRFNLLKPYASRDTPDTDYPWEDFKNIRMNRKKRLLLDAYKRRMFFYAPYDELYSVLTTEELATLYHFPGSAATTPGLPRIQSKRATAPTNLPT